MKKFVSTSIAFILSAVTTTVVAQEWHRRTHTAVDSACVRPGRRADERRRR